MAAVPRSARNLDIEDKDGNQLVRFVVLSSKVDDYMLAARKQGLTLRKFVYNYEKYLNDKKEITILENKQDSQKSQLSNKSYYAFSELFIALMHLKVIRAYIDGVLRFGIPPRFYIGLLKPTKQSEKKIL